MSVSKLDTTKAIATLYRNYLFRSRLEAKWAVFFDSCGWPWSYEPPEFNGWIPDFAIGWMPTLVEIKPFYNSNEWTEAIQKIVQSGCRERVILLGADAAWAFSKSIEEPWYGQIGLVLEMYESQEYGLQVFTQDLHFGPTEGNGKLGLCPMDGGWTNLIWEPPNTPDSNKWSRVYEMEDDEAEIELVARWGHACNVARWLPDATDQYPKHPPALEVFGQLGALEARNAQGG